jgi:putative transposase
MAPIIFGSFNGVDERRRRVAGADRMTIEEVVERVLLDEHADVIREAVRAVAAEMMEIGVSGLIGAELGERRPEDRTTHRNGYRPRRWDTRGGGG